MPLISLPAKYRPLIQICVGGGVVKPVVKIAASSQTACQRLISEHPSPAGPNVGLAELLILEQVGEELSPAGLPPHPRDGGRRDTLPTLTQTQHS